MTKSELRTLYLEKRRTLAADDVAEMSRSIADRFFAHFDLSAIRTVHCFISIPKFNEIDTSIIFRKIWSEFPAIRTIAPRLGRRSDQLEHVPYTPLTDLVENSWGIREPTGGKKADPKEIDLVIVPLLCFDERGYRVGYGKGYYDKFLSLCRPDCIKAGLSFFLPVERITDIHDGDVPLDHCITAEKTYSFQPTSP